ncbi:MAG TPA: TolC family protein [Holophagaceae bacterium]|nr:TolC family protein [Holophagaceae bacterium]
MKRVLTLPALLVAFPLVAQEGPKALSLQEAIETSLKNNLQVGIAESTRDYSKANVLIEGGAFDWNLGASANISKKKDYSLATAGEMTTFSRTATASVLKPFEWGGTFSATYAPSYFVSESNGGPLGGPYAYDGTFSASYTQSLLRGFGREATATRLIVARNGSKVADLSYQKAIIDLVATTESLYWDVVFAKVNLDNKQQSLALAQKQLKENEIRVQVGTLAPIEVTSAQATVAQREQDIISAEAQLLNAKDALIRALYPERKPTAIDTADLPTVAPIAVEEPTSERMAIEKRVELKAAKLNLDSTLVQERAANNRLLPQLDASIGYTGNAANADKLSPVNSDLTGGKYPGYNVGLTFSIPIFNKAARGVQAQARANRRQTELTYKDQELSIVLEVRTAYRNLEAASKGVAAAEKTRVFREKDLEAEQKKFENGMSTNFLVLSKQNDLDSAKSNELQSRIGYAKAVTALEKAQGSLLEARKLTL